MTIKSNDEFPMTNYELTDYPQKIEKRILILAEPLIIWKHVTDPELMQKWMGDPEMKIGVISDWKVGRPIVIKGFHHVQFENKGTILQLEPNTIFQYEYLSSMSNLADKPNNYTTITFHLDRKDDQTKLTVTAKNFPTIEIYKHLEFYWNGTLQLIKSQVESE